MRLEWDFSEVCEKKRNDFEVKKIKRLNKQQAFDQNISDYQAQIAELTKKIVEAEEQKGFFGYDWTSSGSRCCRPEILKGTAHGEESL